ncbi:hypothetical protein NDU88_008354 [Pleurodeles waltl]|uniref:Uncharacterized protein n=1 Tax=Pleurodeles waltl TaxID=8319 RepID=A0AAV7NVU3_PLEWA|nr:hypothetical protein NDU88_008354 [Pleurodeles waltl]
MGGAPSRTPLPRCEGTPDPILCLLQRSQAMERRCAPREDVRSGGRRRAPQQKGSRGHRRAPRKEYLEGPLTPWGVPSGTPSRSRSRGALWRSP